MIRNRVPEAPLRDVSNIYSRLLQASPSQRVRVQQSLLDGIGQLGILEIASGDNGVRINHAIGLKLDLLGFSAFAKWSATNP